MRNQSASAAVSPVTHGQTTPTSSRHCRRHLRCVWLQRISNSSNSPYPGPGPDPDSGSGPSAFQFRPLSFPPFAPRRQPVRHNEHHCVLSAFVVSCSCGPPLLLRLPLSLSLSSLLLPLRHWPGGLFIYSFSCPSAQSVYIFGIGLPCISVCRIVSLSLEFLLCFLALQESGQRQ